MREIFKLSYYANYCMDSNQILHTSTHTHVCVCLRYTPVEITKYPSWVVEKRGKLIQDGERPPSWKIEKSWYLSNHFTDFDKI